MKSQVLKGERKEHILKGFIGVPKGAEVIAEQEVLELVPGAKCVKGDGSLLVEVDTIEDLAVLVYRGQSLSQVLLLLVESIKEADIKSALESSDLKTYLPSTATFACRAYTDDASDQNIAAEVGGIVQDITQAKVNLSQPQVQVIALIKDDAYTIGIDFAGIDMGKRDYRVFSGLEYLKATSAYTALRFSGFTAKQTLLDPFCRSALIPIEAALMVSRFSARFYAKEKLAFQKLPIEHDWRNFFEKQDKLRKEIEPQLLALDDQVRHIASAKKNAKIAGVDKLLTFSRMDIDWLDTKFQEKTVDVVVTFPPEPSKSLAEAKAKKLYAEFFYQTEYFLKPKGNITFIARNPLPFLEAATKRNFKETARMHVYQGPEIFFMIKLQKS